MPTVTLYFDAYNAGEAWSTSPANMVDGNTGTYASTATSGQVQNLNSLSDLDAIFGQITKVEIRGHGYKSGGVQASTLGFRPVFAAGDGPVNSYTLGTTGAWSSYFDITAATNAPGTWTWADVIGLGCDVVGTPSSGRTVYCSRVEIRVTYDDLVVPSGGLSAGGSPATITAGSSGGTSATVNSPAGGVLAGGSPAAVSAQRVASVAAPGGGLAAGATPASVAAVRAAAVGSPAGGLIIGGTPGAVTQTGSPAEIASPADGVIAGGSAAVIGAGTTIGSRAGGLALGGTPGTVTARSTQAGADPVAGGELGGRTLAESAVAGTMRRVAVAAAVGGMCGPVRPGAAVGGMTGRKLAESAAGGAW